MVTFGFLTALSSCVLLFFFVNFTNGQYPAQFHHRCNDTSECQRSNKNTTCIRNVCECSNGLGDTGDQKGECYQPSKLNQTCSNNFNCLAEKQGFGSYCLQTPKNRTCQCKPGFNVTKPANKCIRAGSPNSGPCKSNYDCRRVDSNSQCNSKLCNCQLGYELTGSGCRLRPARLNEVCNINDQCKLYDRNSKCKTSCICEDGYALNRTKTNVAYCGIVKTPINGTCSNDKQCQNFDKYSRCKSNKCQCRKSYDSKLKHCNGCFSLVAAPFQLVLLISALVFVGNEMFTKKQMIA